MASDHRGASGPPLPGAEGRTWPGDHRHRSRPICSSTWRSRASSNWGSRSRAERRSASSAPATRPLLDGPRLRGVDDASAELLLEVVDGAKVGPFAFGIESIDGTPRARLLIASPFGESGIPARLELGRKALWLPPEELQLLPLPIHVRYDLTVPAIPTARTEEVIAEKLARYRRVSLARDLYDLAWFAQRAFDEELVREMTVLKVWGDVVDDKLGDRPLDPEDVLRPREEADFQPEAIGYLTTPVEVPAWIDRVRDRFEFLRLLDATQSRIARCSPGDRWMVSQRIRDLGT